MIPAEGASSNWGNAVVWLREDRVIRVVVNLSADDKLGDLPGVLAGIYGAGEHAGHGDDVDPPERHHGEARHRRRGGAHADRSS
ncbi:hypothetical protein [Sorangium cellulosum]|uniref:hypothetical protein n=1 Tax=Sorangium sp. So ce1024 TaxID=3133327 RepID=UPI0013EDA9C7